MTIIETIERRTEAMKVGELAGLLQVTPQYIYKLAASGHIPCIRIEGAIRLDPQEIVVWLNNKRPKLRPMSPGRVA